MKILIVANHILTVVLYRTELIETLRSQGDEVTVCIPPHNEESRLRELGCAVEHVSVSQHGMNPLRDFRLPFAFRKVIKEVKPDVVLTYTIKPNIYAGMAAGWCDVPCISTITGLGQAFEKGKIIEHIAVNLYKIGTRKTKYVFFQNKANSDLFERYGIARGRHVIVAGSGVNLAKHKLEPYPDDEKGIKLLFAGWVTRDKGVNELVEAVERARATTEQRIVLEFLGGVGDDCQEKLDEWVRDGKVIYLGRHDNVHDYMKRCHAVVLPSYHEGLANVLLEAAACGRPVIASDIPGCKEAFDDGKTGLSCNPREIGSLYASILRFINLPWDDRAIMGKLGFRKIARDFDRDAVVDVYRSHIEK